MQDLQFHAIILAAGSGKRLGYPKAQLKLHGKLMLPIISRAFTDAGCQHLSVVIRQEHEDFFLDQGFRARNLVINNNPEEGRTSSILCALQRVSAEHNLLIHSCDTPLISSSAIQQLIQHWRSAQDPEATIARLCSPGGKGGHPLLVGNKFNTQLQEFQPDQPLRNLIQQNQESLLNVSRVGDPGPFLGINTPEQLEFIENMLTSDF
ncbi:MAG: NTP transferase domain-containing protein [Planctomycetes bacterium]|nr:NTP transferase domain-containing protein [Planctomycetota bacterium]